MVEKGMKIEKEIKELWKSRELKLQKSGFVDGKTSGGLVYRNEDERMDKLQKV